MNIESLNENSWQRVNNYRNLDIAGAKVSSPYFMNNIQSFFVSLMKQAGIEDSKIVEAVALYKQRNIPFGWYRGKGTPEQIVYATNKVSEDLGISLQGSPPEGIREFMKQCGIGVDCSGFVFNVLAFAFEKNNEGDILLGAIDWSDKTKRGVDFAGAFTFAGESSQVVSLDDVRPLDLILTRDNLGQKYDHIALVLEDNSTGLLKTAQSTGRHNMFGVKVDDLTVNGSINFGHRPDIGSSWEQLAHDEKLEFRRLNCLR